MAGDVYGPGGFWQWLLWSHRCSRATATEFQRLFEAAMQRLEGERFTPVALGGDGDWAADGVLDDGRVVFQCYSPDDLTISKVKAKVSRDLPRAVEKWTPVIEEWTFVYNRRVQSGLAPEIIAHLNERRTEYKDLTLSKLSSEDLWGRLYELPAERRAEVLGAPPEAWGGAHTPPPTDTSTAGGDELARCRVVLLQPLDVPLDPTAVFAALEPEVPFGTPYRLQPDWEAGWERVAANQQEDVETLMERAGDRLARFAVFSQAPIPLAIHLGSVLSDRVDVRLFQYDRDRSSWTWDPGVGEERADTDFTLTGLPEEPVDAIRDVCVRVSLSAHVSDADVAGACPEGAAAVALSVADPDVMWLKHPVQLAALGQAYRDLWKRVRRQLPSMERIHLFYAGPAPGAVALGQSFNPRMNPPLLLYEYNRGKTPRYEHVLTVGG